MKDRTKKNWKIGCHQDHHISKKNKKRICIDENQLENLECIFIFYKIISYFRIKGNITILFQTHLTSLHRSVLINLQQVAIGKRVQGVSIKQRIKITSGSLCAAMLSSLILTNNTRN